MRYCNRQQGSCSNKFYITLKNSFLVARILKKNCKNIHTSMFTKNLYMPLTDGLVASKSEILNLQYKILDFYIFKESHLPSVSFIHFYFMDFRTNSDNCLTCSLSSFLKSFKQPFVLLQMTLMIFINIPMMIKQTRMETQLMTILGVDQEEESVKY